MRRHYGVFVTLSFDTERFSTFDTQYCCVSQNVH